MRNWNQSISTIDFFCNYCSVSFPFLNTNFKKSRFIDYSTPKFLLFSFSNDRYPSLKMNVCQDSKYLPYSWNSKTNSKSHFLFLIFTPQYIYKLSRRWEFCLWTRKFWQQISLYKHPTTNLPTPQHSTLYCRNYGMRDKSKFASHQNFGKCWGLHVIVFNKMVMETSSKFCNSLVFLSTYRSDSNKIKNLFFIVFFFTL